MPHKLLCLLLAAMIFSCSPKLQPTTIATRSLDSRGNPMLLGTWPVSSLLDSPYKEWYLKNFKDYRIDTIAANQIIPHLKESQFEIFMGTWCGDSKREVPRMLKLLEYCRVDPSRIKLVMVNDHDSVYKQSPSREERGKFIFRVPDLVVYKKGKETGRIIEYPVVSMESDLLAIIKQESYAPHYKGANQLISYLKQMSTRELEQSSLKILQEIKPFITHPAELNSLGRVLLSDLQYDKAVVVFSLNTAIFPDDLLSKERLAFTYWKMNDKTNARRCCREILAINPQNETALKILAQTML